MNRKLYKFRWSMRRSADVIGIFAATQEQIDAALECDVNFGEIAGKHSEVRGTLGANDLTVLTEDEDFIARAENMGLIPMGHNPLKYVELYCEEHGDSYNPIEGCYECKEAEE